MSFLNPLGLLAGIIAIPIILLYMLRLRRREVVVSSNFLWQQILEDQEANTPWQRLRRNILLLLQLLILLLLVLALARPAWVVPRITAGKTVILLDASASMQATDAGGQSRFEAAQAEALRIINDVNQDDDISLIRVAEVTEPLIAYSGDINRLRQAVNRAQAGQGRGDWNTALTLAAAGAEGADEFRIIIISDGGLPDSVQLPENIPQPIYIAVGESGDNLALAALATRTLPGNPPQLFAQVQNYSAAAAEISLVVRLDGALWESVSSTVSANSQRSFVFDVDADFETIEAELVLDDSVTDYLALDNRAYTVGETSGARQVLLMSPEPNVFIEQALRSIPGLRVFRGNTESTTLPGSNFDLYIFNNWLPDTLPNGDMLIIDPPASTRLFALQDTVQNVNDIRIASRAHPLAAFLNIGAVNIRAFTRLTNIDWAQPIFTSNRGAWLVAGDVQGQQVIVLPVAFADTDFQLNIAFPLFIANALEWFAPGNIVSGTTNSFGVGETVHISPPATADTVRITAPDGISRDLFTTGRTLSYASTDQPGFYALEIIADETIIDSTTFAVNLFGSGESNIAPREMISVGGGAVTGDDSEQVGFHELWIGLVMLAIGVLLWEWRTYHQRLRVPEAPSAPAGRTTARR